MLGEVSPGAALTLRGLAREYHVSMTPAREAVRRRTPYLAVIGFPVGIDDRNRDRRDLFRELWCRGRV